MKPKRPLRIGITSFARQGGSGIVATELGLALAERGHEIHFISHAVPIRLRKFSSNIFFHEVVTGSYPPFPHDPYTLALASKMVEVARYHQLDVLHVHYAIPHAAASYLAQAMLRPSAISTVTTLHGTDITLVGKEPGFFPLTRFVIESSDAVTAVSADLCRQTHELFQVDRPIQVIPNFVDTEIFRPRADLRRKDPLGLRGEKVLMHASNLRKVKNIPAVLDTFAQVHAQMPCKLVIVGEGPERRPAEERAGELGLHEDVIFLGSQDSIEELLALADVLLLPSEHESFGLVALEAMSCGTPVVASNRGGLGEVIVHGESGFMHAPEDTRSAAESVLRILKEEELAADMSARSRARCIEHFQIQKVVQMYLEVYCEQVGKRESLCQGKG